MPRTEVTRFPHGVLEVKLSLPEGQKAPEWVSDLLESGYLTEVCAGGGRPLAPVLGVTCPTAAGLQQLRVHCIVTQQRSAAWLLALLAAAAGAGPDVSKVRCLCTSTTPCRAQMT